MFSSLPTSLPASGAAMGIDDAPDLFTVDFQGSLIACNSLDDAVAVKNANSILDNQTENEYSPRELDRLANVLIRYGQDAAAETLSHISCRMRAAHFLVDRMGYAPPAHHHQS
jgi:hypothetical protein